MSDIHEQVHAFADGELEPAEAQSFQLHLAGCQQCQQELEDILQLQALGARLAARPSSGAQVLSLMPARAPAAAEAPAQRASRPSWRRGALVGGLGVALAAAVALMVLRPGQEPSALGPGALALAPTRAMEARLSWEGASGWRPYGVTRSGGQQLPVEQVSPRAQLALEEAGDWHGLATTYLLQGQAERASTALERAPASPEVDNERAVLAMARGEWAQALALLERVLQARPQHPQALWNRGLVLRELGRAREAAESFRQVAALGEPGWSQEALQRAEALERQ